MCMHLNTEVGLQPVCFLWIFWVMLTEINMARLLGGQFIINISQSTTPVLVYSRGYTSLTWFDVCAFPLFQVIVCSATLHSFDVKKLSERIMHFPTWVDLKGEDSVPETVHHVVVPVNPKSDRLWERLGKNRIRVSLPRQDQDTLDGRKNPTDVFKIKERNRRRLLKEEYVLSVNFFFFTVLLLYDANAAKLDCYCCKVLQD